VGHRTTVFGCEYCSYTENAIGFLVLTGFSVSTNLAVGLSKVDYLRDGFMWMQGRRDRLWIAAKVQW
jgi:hypothetical protein